MPSRWSRLGLSVVIGAMAAVVTRTLDIPGNGSWIAACWFLGVVAAAVERSWASFAACVAGIALATIVFVAGQGQYAGLAWLVVACEAAVLGHGFLVSAVVGRAWRLRSLKDARVAWGLTAAVGLVVAFVLIAEDFARNPP